MKNKSKALILRRVYQEGLVKTSVAITTYIKLLKTDKGKLLTLDEKSKDQISIY